MLRITKRESTCWHLERSIGCNMTRRKCRSKLRVIVGFWRHQECQGLFSGGFVTYRQGRSRCQTGGKFGLRIRRAYTSFRRTCRPVGDLEGMYRRIYGGVAMIALERAGHMPGVEINYRRGHLSAGG